MLGMSWQENLELMLRVLAATGCGGIIGLERERRIKSAGMITHMIVAASAAMMMLVSKYGFWDVMVGDQVKLDPSRVAAGIVSAIGFLGAGIIFNRGFKINGINTAAGLWATVGIGMLFGSGLYLLGALSTALLTVIHLPFQLLKDLVQRSPANVNLRARGTMDEFLAFRDKLKKMHCFSMKVTLTPIAGTDRYEIDLHFSMTSHNYERQLLDILKEKELEILMLDVEP